MIVSCTYVILGSDLLEVIKVGLLEGISLLISVVELSEGILLGVIVGTVDGIFEEILLGGAVGTKGGRTEGILLGVPVSRVDGLFDGMLLGVRVGGVVGTVVGEIDG